MKRSAAVLLLSVVAVSGDFYLGIQHCEDDQGLYVVSIQNYLGDCNVETAYFEKLWATLYMTIKTCVRTTYTPGLPYSYFLAHDSSVSYILVMSYSSKSRCETAQAALLAEIQSAPTETALGSFWDSNGYQDAINLYATGDTDCFDAKVFRASSLPGSCPQAPYAYSQIKFVAYAGTVADVKVLGEGVSLKVSDGCAFPGETCPIEGRTVGQTDPPSPSTPPPLPPQPPASPADATNHSTNDGAATATRPGVVVGGVVSGTLAVLLVVVIAVVLKKKKKATMSVTPS